MHWDHRRPRPGTTRRRPRLLRPASSSSRRRQRILQVAISLASGPCSVPTRLPRVSSFQRLSHPRLHHRRSPSSAKLPSPPLTTTRPSRDQASTGRGSQASCPILQAHSRTAAPFSTRRKWRREKAEFILVISFPPLTLKRRYMTRRMRTELRMVCQPQVRRSSSVGRPCKPHPPTRPHPHIGLPGTRRTRNKPVRRSLHPPRAIPRSLLGRAALAAERLHSRLQAHRLATDTREPRVMVCLGYVRPCRTCSSTKALTSDSGVRVTARQLPLRVPQT